MFLSGNTLYVNCHVGHVHDVRRPLHCEHRPTFNSTGCPRIIRTQKVDFLNYKLHYAICYIVTLYLMIFSRESDQMLDRASCFIQRFTHDAVEILSLLLEVSGESQK